MTRKERRMRCWRDTTREYLHHLSKATELGTMERAGADIARDGVHFNSLGYEVLWRAMSELIRTKFKGRGLDFEDLDDLPLRAPL